MCLWTSFVLTLVTLVLVVSPSTPSIRLPEIGRSRYFVALGISAILGTARFEFKAPRRDLIFISAGTLTKILFILFYNLLSGELNPPLELVPHIYLRGLPLLSDSRLLIPDKTTE